MWPNISIDPTEIFLSVLKNHNISEMSNVDKIVYAGLPSQFLTSSYSDETSFHFLCDWFLRQPSENMIFTTEYYRWLASKDLEYPRNTISITL